MPKVKDETMPAPQKAKRVEAKKREVLYPEIRVNGIVIPRERLVITVEKMRAVLGWENEEEYRERIIAECKKSGANIEELLKEKPEKFLIPADDVLLTDFHGRKVACWNNARNRDFDERHCKEMAQSMLEMGWYFNGESLIVGETGMTISLQHRGCALMLAEELRTMDQYAEHWKAQGWKEPVTIEALLVTGVKEDQDTISTLDNVKPRTEADIISTSDLFAKLPKGERSECSKMLATAIDLVWRRTKADEDGWMPGDGHTVQYQTNAAAMKFLKHHERLKEAAVHLYQENQDRLITKQRLSAGKCAGLMYLMACCQSDIDEYRNTDPRNEKVLKFDDWTKAEEFFSLIGSNPEFEAVRVALKALSSEDTGVGGTDAEKQSILVKGWESHREGGAITAKDLQLDYQEDSEGNITKDGKQYFLIDPPTLGGIDQGIKVRAPKERAPTKEEIKRRAAVELAAKLNAMRGKRVPGEVAAPDPVEYDKDGKPPMLPRTQQDAAQTAKAKADDDAGKVSDVARLAEKLIKFKPGPADKIDKPTTPKPPPKSGKPGSKK